MSDVVERILAYNAGRNPQLVAIKYKKMRDDPFAFFRGTCHVFYEDWPQNSPLNDAPSTWICGDLHLQNFGIYRGDDELTYFDIDDFDESLLAPVVWDITRFLVSIAVAFPRGKTAERKQLSQVYLDAYTTTLAKGQQRSIHTAVANPPLKTIMQKREQRNSTVLLDEWTTRTKKMRHFKTDSSKIRPISDADYKQAIRMLKKWSDTQPEAKVYKVLDVATRLSGLGSMGVDRYLMLVEGLGSSNQNHLIELKQRSDPAGQDYTKQRQPEWKSAAERVVTLQSQLQAVPPAPLAAIVQGKKSFTVHELYPADEKIALKNFKQINSSLAFVEAMGCCTAYAHLRGCGRQGASSASDLSHFATDAKWQKVVQDYSADYCQKLTQDYKVFCASRLGKGKPKKELR